MEKGGFLKSKRIVKNTTIVTIWFVVIALISSGSLSANLNNNLKDNNSNLSIIDEETPIVLETSSGIAPKNHIKNSNLQTNPVESLEEIMYGYIVDSPTFDEGPCCFPLDDPGSIDLLQETISDDFLSGGTGGVGEWWACEYSTGALWEIDPETGDMTSIGGGGVGLNGLAWDPMYSRLYGATGSSLYEIDPWTGEQEFIGSFGSGVNVMIGISVDLDGNMYGWDLGYDKLWEIDLQTADILEVGSLGIDLNYAQDGCFDWDTNMLWLTAYTVSPNYGSYLYYWDWDAEECVLVGQIEDNSQITASVTSLGWYCCEHDVGVKSIDLESGYAVPDIPMEVTVKNYGPNPETFDAKMEVIGNQTGSLLLDEEFSGSFPPEGWETDSWTQCNSSCCHESPCACLTYYQGPQYIWGNITSKPVDASENSSCTLNYYLCADMYYAQYCSLYIKIRKNETSPWKDVTPWDNPLDGDIEGDYYQIDIHSFNNSEGCGEALQIKWEFLGYYYYYVNNVCLDSVSLVAIDEYYEYAELVEDITLDPGETMQIDFPTWTPTQWQDPEYENTWVEYLVQAKTLLGGDQRPKNDYKYKYIELYFPWMHDIEITSVYPCEDGPGMTFPVKAIITNVGQNDECCIPIDISIGEPVVLDTLLHENAWETVPPEGWYDEHKDFDPEFGWDKSYSSYSGGSPYEARLQYTKALPDYVFYSYSFDTSEYSNCRLEFLSYINHYSGSGLYALEVGYSYDGINWYAAWHEEPSSSGNYEVSVIIEGGFETTYIGFWVTGNPYYFNYWYIDDVSVKILDYVSEYSDSAYQGDYFEPGESRTLEFNDWTPDYLQYETSGSIDYIVHAEIEMPGDQNPGNDILSEYFTLEYWHDAGIYASSPNIITKKQDLLWDNGEPDGRNGLPSSMYQSYSNIVIDDFSNEDNWYVAGGHFRFIWNQGYGAGNLETIHVYFFENQGDCDPSLDEWAKVEVTEFNEWLTGNYYFSRPEIAVDFIFDDVYLPWDSKWYVGFQPEGITDDIAYLLTAEGYGCSVMADLPYFGYPRWTSSQEIWDEEYDLAWELHGWAGCMCPSVYIQPGIEDIDAIAENLGTFPEMDLTGYAEIYEYITDPDNKTLVYEDNITDIDLTEPLGGTVVLEFDDFDFSMEGNYVLDLKMPAPNDDYRGNNRDTLKVRVDDTEPYSTHELDPPLPDGENGWYVNDIEVKLEATDPFSNGVNSGIREIKYKINDGPIKTIPGNCGYFLLTQEHDGDDVLVEYWAIDKVGNEETQHHKFTIDMDQTCPSVDLTYKVTGGNPKQGWTMLFTATATDAISGMDHVEFYLNDVFQKAVTGPGPKYQWSFIYHGGIYIDILSVAFDNAGNMAFDIVEDPHSFSFNHNAQQQTQSNTKSYFLHNSQQKLFEINGV